MKKQDGSNSGSVTIKVFYDYQKKALTLHANFISELSADSQILR